MQPGNVKMQMGTQVVPDAVLSETTLFDLLYVPGGVGAGPMSQDAAMLDVIRRHYDAGKHRRVQLLGVGILHRAGILGDNPVTCVAGDRQEAQAGRRQRARVAPYVDRQSRGEALDRHRLLRRQRGERRHRGPLLRPRRRHDGRDDVRRDGRDQRGDLRARGAGVLSASGAGSDVPGLLGADAAAGAHGRRAA